MLKNGEISVGVFLATMANRKNNIVYADEIISLNEREVQLAQESESYGGHDDVDHEEFAEFSDSDTETIFSGEDLPEPSITQLRTRKNAETSESTAGRSLFVFLKYLYFKLFYYKITLFFLTFCFRPIYPEQKKFG